MGVTVIRDVDNCTSNEYKLSGAALCTAGQVFKLLSDGFITPVSAVSDKPFGVFLNTVTATSKEHLGKDNQVPVALEGATIKTTKWATGNKPTVGSAVWFDASADPHGNVSGGCVYGLGNCVGSDSSSAEIYLKFHKASDY